MMAEKYPFGHRMVILIVAQQMGGGDTRRVQDKNLGGEKDAVIAVSDGEGAQRQNHDR